jgi:hypothetical protein
MLSRIFLPADIIQLVQLEKFFHKVCGEKQTKNLNFLTLVDTKIDYYYRRLYGRDKCKQYSPPDKISQSAFPGHYRRNEFPRQLAANPWRYVDYNGNASGSFQGEKISFP